MKLKFNCVHYYFFYCISMKLDINIEISKLNKILNDKGVESFQDYYTVFRFLKYNIKVEYLLYVLELTYEHPEIEIYLKQLLENFSITELNNLDNDNQTILHEMMYRFSISLNTFEIIINFGINVNSQTKNKNTPLHIMSYAALGYMTNIIRLFVKYGADLNILNRMNRTVLDEILYIFTNSKLDEDSKILIMTIIDFGAKTNNPDLNTSADLLEFVESYFSNNIKPAIKK